MRKQRGRSVEEVLYWINVRINESMTVNNMSSIDDMISSKHESYKLQV